MASKEPARVAQRGEAEQYGWTGTRVCLLG